MPVLACNNVASLSIWCRDWAAGVKELGWCVALWIVHELIFMKSCVCFFFNGLINIACFRLMNDAQVVVAVWRKLLLVGVKESHQGFDVPDTSDIG